MLSYQHGYHAGNFADVVKHLTLCRILNYMCSKDKPLLYLETHSGRGMYDLKDGQATKNSEFLQGMSLLWAEKHHAPEVFAPYLTTIKTLNSSGTLRYYPGSPYFAIQGLRDCDRLVCDELHPREFTYLEQLPTHGKRVFFNHLDGIQHLSAMLPPPERRGLTFIDPSYELKDEYKTIPNAINMAFNRFATGVYGLWYPIVDKRLHEQLIRNLKRIDSKNVLRLEFYVTDAKEPGMTGCGVWVINPPYTLADEMKQAFTFLRTIFNPGKSSFLIEG